MNAVDRNHSQKAKKRQRGSVYLMVLAVGAVVLVVGLAGIALARVRLVGAHDQQALMEARLLADSAIAHAVGIMNAPDTKDTWRQNYVHDQATSPVLLDTGQMSFRLADDDRDLADDPTDPVWIEGIGRAGQAVWFERARARVYGGPPLACLRTAIHTCGDMEIKGGKQLTAYGAPASTDGNLKVDGSLTGDAEAVTLSGGGSIDGTLTTGVALKGAPWRSIFDDYAARATAIPYDGHLDEVVLGPGVNEYGGAINPDGLYYLDTDGHDIEIKNTRLYGTLVIDAVNKKVIIKEWDHLSPYRSDYPVLIIKGNLESDQKTGLLMEATGHNYNPPGAPYQGHTDSDQLDSYPCEVHGLVHVMGTVKFKGNDTFRGAIACEGKVTVESASTIVHDPNLILNPPIGYTADPNHSNMILAPHTLSRLSAD